MESELSIPYDEPEQAKLRLAGTIIVVGGVPVEVLDVKKAKDRLVVHYTTLPNKHAVEQVDLMDAEVNIRKLPLGYVNAWGEAVYLRRIPARQQRQGLCNANVSVSPLVRNGRVPRFYEIASLGSFSDMVKHIYPSVDEALDLFGRDPERLSVAIHRHFAIHIDRDLNFYTLNYKGNRVAWGDPNLWNLPSHLAYMEGLLKENNINFRM